MCGSMGKSRGIKHHCGCTQRYCQRRLEYYGIATGLLVACDRSYFGYPEYNVSVQKPVNATYFIFGRDQKTIEFATKADRQR